MDKAAEEMIHSVPKGIMLQPKANTHVMLKAYDEEKCLNFRVLYNLAKQEVQCKSNSGRFWLLDDLFVSVYVNNETKAVAINFIDLQRNNDQTELEYPMPTDCKGLGTYRCHGGSLSRGDNTNLLVLCMSDLDSLVFVINLKDKTIKGNLETNYLLVPKDYDTEAIVSFPLFYKQC